MGGGNIHVNWQYQVKTQKSEKYPIKLKFLDQAETLNCTSWVVINLQQIQHG